MTMTPDEYRKAISAALIEAIMVTGRDGPGSATVVYSGEACEELINAIALVLHNSDEVSSPTKARRTCDELARKLQRRIAAMREAAAQGKLNFVITPPVGKPN